MPKRWTEAEAVTLLESRGAETKDDFIILDGCCKGLTGGSALDYLLNNHNYRLGVKPGWTGRRKPAKPARKGGLMAAAAKFLQRR